MLFHGSQEQLEDKSTINQKRPEGKYKMAILIPTNTKEEQENNINIFKGLSVEALNENQMNRGPKFDQFGNLIKRSIIGQTEAFARQLHINFCDQQPKLNCYTKQLSRRNLAKLAVEEKNQISKLGSPTNSLQNSNMVAKQDSNRQTQYIQKNQSCDSQFSQKNQSIDQNDDIKPSSPLRSYKKPKQKVISFTKIVLLQQMKNVENQLMINKQNQEKMISRLNPTEQRIYTKEQRMQSKFDAQTDVWNYTTIDLGGQLGRQASETLLQRSTQYREKLESLMINEAMNGESAKIKSSYWYADLRNSPEKNVQISPVPFNLHLKKLTQSKLVLKLKTEEQIETKAIVESDYNSKFWTTHVRNPSKYSEIVRSNYCQSIQSPSILESKSMLFYQSPTKFDQGSATSRFNENKSLSQLKVFQQENNCQLEGLNVYQKELKHLQRDGQDLYSKYNRFIPNELQVAQEELIAEDKSPLNMIRSLKNIKSKRVYSVD